MKGPCKSFRYFQVVRLFLSCFERIAGKIQQVMDKCLILRSQFQIENTALPRGVKWQQITFGNGMGIRKGFGIKDVVCVAVGTTRSSRRNGVTTL
jgi:hypothetical protein